MSWCRPLFTPLQTPTNKGTASSFPPWKFTRLDCCFSVGSRFLAGFRKPKGPPTSPIFLGRRPQKKTRSRSLSPPQATPKPWSRRPSPATPCPAMPRKSNTPPGAETGGVETRVSGVRRVARKVSRSSVPGHNVAGFRLVSLEPNKVPSDYSDCVVLRFGNEGNQNSAPTAFLN